MEAKILGEKTDTQTLLGKSCNADSIHNNCKADHEPICCGYTLRGPAGWIYEGCPTHLWLMIRARLS